MPDRVYDDDEVPGLIAQTYLPEPLPDHWVVLPKRLLQWAGINILLLGGAIGSLLTALAASFLPVGFLFWIVPGVAAVVYLLRKFVLTPSGDEALDTARQALNQSDSRE